MPGLSVCERGCLWVRMHVFGGGGRGAGWKPHCLLFCDSPCPHVFHPAVPHVQMISRVVGDKVDKRVRQAQQLLLPPSSATAQQQQKMQQMVAAAAAAAGSGGASAGLPGSAAGLPQLKPGGSKGALAAAVKLHGMAGWLFSA